MTRHALTHCLIFVAAAGALALPGAQAGGAINKCIDSAGRVTLTDQACDGHTVSSTVVVAGTQDNDAASMTVPVPAPVLRSAPLRQARPMPAATPVLAPHIAFAGDMATMKQARIQMLLQDAAPRTRLAAR